MKLLSWNIRGLGSEDRRAIVKDLIRSEKVHMTLLQESKLRPMSEKTARELWGSRFVRWLARESVGLVGGFILPWDTRKFQVLDS